MRPFVLGLALSFATAPGVLAQDASPRSGAAPAIDYETARFSRVVSAVRVTEAITLDGRLDEPAWNLAVPATDFTQRRPRAGELATDRTEVRFLYDNDNLYIGVLCFDAEPDRIVVNSVQRDYATQESDGVSVLIDSLHDRRSGFNFVANPAGAKRDAQLSNDGTGNVDWNGVWDVKTSINGEGWIAEYVIPFTTLRFSSSPSQEWGLQLTRRVPRKNEEADWAPLPQYIGNFRMSMAGTLNGLENVRQGRNLKVKPYISAGTTQSRGAAGQMQTVRGLNRLEDYDAGFDVKYSLTPSLTLDATYRTDFAQVEVDQQQVNLTRFNQFFPEKRDFFLENTGIFAFGPGGNLVPFFSRRIGLSSAGTPIPITGGTRVSGKVGQYDVGVLAMRTEQLGATPANNFLVGRLKRNLWRSSWLGTLVTSRDSALPGAHNLVSGIDAHVEFFGKLEFDTYLLQSNTPGRSGDDQARRFQTGWTDDEFSASAQYNSVQPNFNPEVGFIRRRDMEQYAGSLAWKPLLRDSALIRNFEVGTAVDYFENSGTGRMETRTSNIKLGVLFENAAFIDFTVNRTFDRLTTLLRIPSGTPRVVIPAADYRFDNYQWTFSTNQRLTVSGNGAYNRGGFYGGDHDQVIAGLNLKPNYHLLLSLTYDRNQVTLPGGSFTTNLVGAKAIYGFSPQAFLNAFIQYNADTHAISSNLRFDLIHHPLSDLYIVYNDTHDTLLHRTRERAFIVKLTNLFSF